MRSPEEAEQILAAELSRLEPRREALGAEGCFAVAGWTLQHALEWEAALLAWRQVTAYKPRNVEAAYAEALCLLEMSRFADAAQRFRDVIELDAETVGSGGEGLDWMEDDPEYRLGVALHAMGDLTAAIEAYERSASRNEIAVDALREICRARIALGHAKEAIDAANRLERRAIRLTVRAEALQFRAEARSLLRGS